MMEDLGQNRLYRSRHERMFLGVCGGLAQYLGTDPALVRLGFVLLGLLTGIGVLAYIILAVVIPERPADMLEPVVVSHAALRGGRELAAYALIALGAIALASNVGFFHLINWDFVWPVAIVGIGLLLLARRSHD